MIPTQVPEPFHRDGWVYEEKVDGWRILVYKDGPRVRLVSRTGVEHSNRFRAVAEAVAALRFDTLVLDGKVAIFDQQLRSRFDWLRATPDELATPPIYIAFDVLYRAGERRDRPPAARPPRAARRRARWRREVRPSSATPRRQRAGCLGAGAGQRLRGLRREGSAQPVPRRGVTRSWLKVKMPGWTDPDEKWTRVRLGPEK
jgi:hypothetical protein